jgi:hypothetical protein
MAFDYEISNSASEDLIEAMLNFLRVAKLEYAVMNDK